MKEFWVGQKSGFQYDVPAHELEWGAGDIGGRGWEIGSEYADYANQASNRARGLAGEALYQGMGARSQQQDLAEMLLARARGETTSAAEKQMQQGIAASQRAAASQAAGMRGVAPGLASYLSNQQAAGTRRDVIGQTGVLRAQEQAAAEQAYGGLLGQMRGMDVGREQMYNQLQQQYMGMGLGAKQAALAAQEAEERLRLGAYQATQQARAGAWRDRVPGFAEQLAGTGVSIMGMSLMG